MVVFFSIVMEEAVAIALNKRQKTETDCQLCIICQVNTHDEPLILMHRNRSQCKSTKTLKKV